MAFDANSLYSASGRRSNDPFQGGNDFNPPPASRPRASGAGYNQDSFLDSGRVEPLKGGGDEESQVLGHTGGTSSPNEHEAGWDVFADFNNTGPRYSTAFGSQEPA